MSTNHTPNYQLSQWERTDRVQMEDFNSDNAKIDAAIKAEAEARAAGDTALTGLIGQRNCQFVTGTYQGTGGVGSAKPTSLTFPRKPVFLTVSGGDRLAFWAMRGQTSVYFYGAGAQVHNTVSWSGNTVKWYYNPGGNVQLDARYQLNASGTTYRYFAILEMEG